MAQEADIVRLLILDDNPLVRRALEDRAMRRTDVVLEAFSSPLELLSRLSVLEHSTIDLVVCDRGEGDKLDTLTNVFVRELLRRGFTVVLIADSNEQLVKDERVLQCVRPVLFDDLVAMARSQSKRRSEMRLMTTRAYEEDRQKTG